MATHLGAGGWMVVDAHPKVDSVAYSDGGTDYVGYWRPRIQVRDASFSLKPTQDAEHLLRRLRQPQSRLRVVAESTAPGKAAQPKFSDAKTYWYADAPEAGVKIPKNLGVRITVKSMGSDTMTIRVDNVK